MQKWPSLTSCPPNSTVTGTTHFYPVAIRSAHVIYAQALSNIPVFQTEDFMPPENEVMSRVEFSYARTNDDRSPDKYWNDFGKAYYTYLEDAMEKSKILSKTAGEIVSPDD